MKPLIAIALCLCLLALCACGQAKPNPVSVPTFTVVTTIKDGPTIFAEDETTITVPTTTQSPTITAAPTTQLIQYPASYKDAPEAYKPVLDAFYYQARPTHWGDGEACVIGGEYIAEPIFTQTDNLGYAIKDINNDGIPELLLLDLNNIGWGNPEGLFIHALFTLKDDKPVELGQYWRRNHIQLAADGTIYEYGVRNYASYKLDAQATELTRINAFHNDGAANCFARTGDGEWEPITDDEYNALLKLHSNPPNPMPLTFILIEQ